MSQFLFDILTKHCSMGLIICQSVLLVFHKMYSRLYTLAVDTQLIWYVSICDIPSGCIKAHLHSFANRLRLPTCERIGKRPKGWCQWYLRRICLGEGHVRNRKLDSEGLTSCPSVKHINLDHSISTLGPD